MRPGLELSLAACLFLVAPLGACGHPVQRQLEGRWFGDSVENFEQRELPLVTGWVRGVSFEFSGPKVTVAVPAEEPRSGKFTVASVRQNDVRLAIERPTGEKDTLRLRLDDDRNARWMIDEVHAIVLRREE